MKHVVNICVAFVVFYLNLEPASVFYCMAYGSVIVTRKKGY